MFQILGYNFFLDGDALNVGPTSVENIVNTRLTNAVFEHFNATKDVSIPYNDEKPTWDFDTIMDTTFDNTINAGNIDYLVSQISAIKIKRRIKGTFNWITLKTIPVNGIEDLTFVFNDFLAVGDTQYEYALVPILEGSEGDYIINEILSKFNGVFIGDAETTYKMLYDVNYGTNKRNQQIGTFEPLGKKYPIMIANGILSYDSGSLSAAIINDDFEQTGELNVGDITRKKELMKDFLTNHKPKILRDWSHNSWLCVITEAPQITYANNSGMRVPYLSCTWSQIGDVNNAQDLYDAGLIDEVE